MVKNVSTFSDGPLLRLILSLLHEQPWFADYIGESKRELIDLVKTQAQVYSFGVHFTSSSYHRMQGLSDR